MTDTIGDRARQVREADAIVVDALLDGTLTHEDVNIFNRRAKATWLLVDVATMEQFVAKRKKDAEKIFPEFEDEDNVMHLLFENQWMRNRLGLLAEYLDNLLANEINFGTTTGPQLNAHLKFIREFK